MKPSRFEYVRPHTLVEALSILENHGSDAAVLAGGQSLMPMMNLRMAQPAVVIDINAIKSLGDITVTERAVVGGRARHNDVLHCAGLVASGSLLIGALPYVAHEAIRNRGTLGGSLALADPAAELPACAVCLGAEITAASSRGERTIEAPEFFKGLYSTALEPDELITRVIFPLLDNRWYVEFDEIGRRHGDFAIAALALAVRLVDGRVTDCRIVFAGVESHPRRVTAAENALVGTSLTDLVSVAVARDLLKGELDPLGESQYPGGYRVHLAEHLLDRLLLRIVRRGVNDERR